jgi:hypothetical protein
MTYGALSTANSFHPFLLHFATAILSARISKAAPSDTVPAKRKQVRVLGLAIHQLITRANFLI